VRGGGGLYLQGHGGVLSTSGLAGPELDAIGFSSLKQRGGWQFGNTDLPCRTCQRGSDELAAAGGVRTPEADPTAESAEQVAAEAATQVPH